MRVRKKIDFLTLFLYILCGVASACLFHVGTQYEPFPLGLLFAMASAGLSPIWSSILYILTSCLSRNTAIILVCAGQAVLLSVGFYLQKRFFQTPFLKTGFLPLLALSLSLGLFCAFAPFVAYKLPISGLSLNSLTQKILLAALLFLLSAIMSVAMKALLHKLLKCRLRDDEIVFSLFFFVLIGVGACRFLSINAYMGIAFFVLLLFSYATKDTSGAVCAFILSLPPFLVAGLSPARFFLYGISLPLFMKSGRLAAVCAFLALFFSFGYLDGIFAYSSDQLMQSVFSAVSPALLFILLPTPLLRELENRLIFYREKHLSRIAINRNRSVVGEQLFEISSVFREIETAFSCLGNNEAETAAKNLVRENVLLEVCQNCPNRMECENERGRDGFNSLIDVGCMKGRVSLIDIPNQLSDICINQSGLLYAVNRQLIDYKKYMLEAENASTGRALLANQALGVSEILKNLALDQSEPLRIYTDKERALNIAFLSAGIVCSEVMVYGDEHRLTLSLVSFGKADVKKIAAIASHILDTDMMISERIALSHNKFCCILHRRSIFDAAFGVSCMKKDGEQVSGDTHSVIKIDESKFMVALSDGMGSGEYAKRVSESTIALLESFYRAKMPSELILSTVNKLLTFHKEESFACVDIATVDLNSGNADIVKIGAPVGFILSDNTVKILENASLPLGILDSVHPATSEYQLSENDILLFISDGVSDAFGSITDLYETLRSVPVHNPQQLADTLLQRALASQGGKAKDDMTAVAVRLFKHAA